MNTIDLTRLPASVLRSLADIQQELEEGDITQKGYDKKRAKIFEGYLAEQLPTQPQNGVDVPQVEISVEQPQTSTLNDGKRSNPNSGRSSPLADDYERITLPLSHSRAASDRESLLSKPESLYAGEEPPSNTPSPALRGQDSATEEVERIYLHTLEKSGSDGEETSRKLVKSDENEPADRKGRPALPPTITTKVHSRSSSKSSIKMSIQSPPPSGPLPDIPIASPTPSASVSPTLAATTLPPQPQILVRQSTADFQLEPPADEQQQRQVPPGRPEAVVAQSLAHEVIERALNKTRSSTELRHKGSADSLKRAVAQRNSKELRSKGSIESLKRPAAHTRPVVSALRLDTTTDQSLPPIAHPSPLLPESMMLPHANHYVNHPHDLPQRPPPHRPPMAISHYQSLPAVRPPTPGASGGPVPLQRPPPSQYPPGAYYRPSNPHYHPQGPPPPQQGPSPGASHRQSYHPSPNPGIPIQPGYSYSAQRPPPGPYAYRPPSSPTSDIHPPHLPRPPGPSNSYPQRPGYNNHDASIYRFSAGGPSPAAPGIMASPRLGPVPSNDSRDGFRQSIYMSYSQGPGYPPGQAGHMLGAGGGRRKSFDSNPVGERDDPAGLARAQTIRGDLVQGAQRKDWDTGSVKSLSWGGGRTRSGSVASSINPPISIRSGSIRRRSGYMSGSFRTVEPAQMPTFHPDDFDPQELADLAGLQMFPLEPREIPFRVMDPNGHTEMSSFSNIAAIMRYRALNTPRNPAFAICDPKGKELANLTWDKVNARAEKVAHIIRDKSGLDHGGRVALIYRKSEILDFVAAFFGCFLAGVVAVPINAAEEMAELSFILNSTGAWLALTTDHNLRAFTRDLEARRAEFPPNIEWWKTNEFGSWYPQRKGSTEYPPILAPDLAYVEYSKAPNGELKGVAISHRTIMAQCTAYKGAVTPPSDRPSSSQFSPGLKDVATQGGVGPLANAQSYNHSSDVVVSYIEPRQQVGLILGVLCGVFCGNFTVFVSSSVMDTPAVWVNLLTRYRATVALADYGALRSAMYTYMKDPLAITNFQKKQPPDLSSLRYLLVDALLVDAHLSHDIADKFLQPLGCEWPEEVISPLASLPEHGGMILSLRDFVGPAHLEEVVGEREGGPTPVTPGSNKAEEDGMYGSASGSGSGSAVSDRPPRSERPLSIRVVLAAGSSRDAWECLLDREALKRNKIVVLATGKGAQENFEGTKVMRVGAFGFVMPEATVAIVDPETSALCPPDMVGEIWVDSPSLSGGFWALPKHTEAIFHAKPMLIPPDTLTPEPFNQEFLRTGLLGCVIGGRVIVFGLYEDRIRQQALGFDLGVDEYHYAPDLVKTIMNKAAVDICTTFETFVNDEHLPVVVCESGLPKEELEKVSDRIVEALLEDHGVRVYSVVVCPPGSLPRHFKNGRRVLHAMLCKKAFELGRLPPVHLRLDTDRTVFNVAWGDDLEGGIWKSSVAYENARRRGDIPHGGPPQHTGMEPVAEVMDERTSFDLTKFTNITDVLLWRTAMSPDDTAYYIMEGRGREGKTITWRKLNSKIAAVATFLRTKGVKPTDHVLLVFPHSMDFIEAVHACLVLGAVPIPVQQPETARLREDINSIISIVVDLRVSHILVNTQTEESIKSKPAQQLIKQAFPGNAGATSKFPEIINVLKAPKFSKMLGKESGFLINAEWLDPKYTAIILVYYTPDARRYCVKMGHDTIVAQCRTQKVTCQMKSQRGLVTCVKSFSGLGFLQGTMSGIYVGCPTVLISPADYYATPTIWFDSINRFKVKDAFATYPMIQHAMANVANSDYRHFTLQSVQNLMLATDTRPKPEYYHQILSHFSANRLEKEAINTVYSHIMNPMISTRSYMLMEPVSLYLELRSLRKGIVRPITPEEDPFGVMLHDSGIVPSTTMIAIVNPETRMICPNNVVGEIWVASDANVKSFYGSDDIMARFAATIEGGDRRTVYARTGDLGFLWTVQRGGDPMSHGMGIEEGQCLFVLGPIGETFEVNGLMHFPVDVELTIEKCHPMVASEGCIIFQGIENEVVAVVQIKSPDFALSLIPVIVGAVLDEHQFKIDLIVLVAHGQLPKSRLGEKQRGKALAAHLNGSLNVIHIRKVTGNYSPLPMPFSEENGESSKTQTEKV